MFIDEDGIEIVDCTKSSCDRFDVSKQELNFCLQTWLQQYFSSEPYSWEQLNAQNAIFDYLGAIKDIHPSQLKIRLISPLVYAYSIKGDTKGEEIVTVLINDLIEQAVHDAITLPWGSKAQIEAENKAFQLVSKYLGVNWDTALHQYHLHRATTTEMMDYVLYIWKTSLTYSKLEECK